MSTHAKAKVRRPNSWWTFIDGWSGVVSAIFTVILSFGILLLLGSLPDARQSYAHDVSVSHTQFVQDFQSHTPAERRVVAQFLIELHKQGSGFDPTNYGDDTMQQLQHTAATGSVPVIDTHVAVQTSWTDVLARDWFVSALVMASIMLGFFTFVMSASRKHYLADMPRGFVRRALFVACTVVWLPFYLVSWLRMRKHGFIDEVKAPEFAA